MKQFNKDGIRIVEVENSSESEKFVRNFLYKNSDSETALFLSGGKTPKSLYDQLLAENKLRYGAVGMTDERYGKVGHDRSNANMMSGFKPFYPILNGKSLENTALQYDKTVRSLFTRFQKSIGILGIGSDGHTAGVPAIPKIAKEIIEDKTSLVRSYDQPMYHALMHDTLVKYGQRITMTFNALAKLDQIIILVFGRRPEGSARREEKKEALRLMFTPGPEWEIPARFYLRPEIAKKTILITDQKI